MARAGSVLATVKSLVQLGATLGREFSCRAAARRGPVGGGDCAAGAAPVKWKAEFLYQRGVPPQATYTFEHALIQDVAYQSLFRNTRQKHHQRIAQAWGPVPGDRRDAPRAGRPALHGGGLHRASGKLLGTAVNKPATARPISKPSAT